MDETLKMQLWDPIRNSWVASTPEERVRQRLIQEMLHVKGFPQSGLCVEKALQQLPHISSEPPLRRADILVFAKDIHPNYALYPLLMIECKAVPLSEAAQRQVAGYNHFVQAYFVAVANEEKLRLGWQGADGSYSWVDYLPNYTELLSSLT